MSPDTLTVIVQAGALGVLVLVLVGFYLLIKLCAPHFRDIVVASKEFLAGLVSEQRENRTATAALAEKVATIPDRITLSEERIKAHFSQELARVQDTVRVEADRTGENVAVTVSHAVDVITRQGTDPNLPAVTIEPALEPAPPPHQLRGPATPALGFPALRPLPAAPPSRPGGGR